MTIGEAMQPTLFIDTQGLIYAFEARDRLWLDFIDSQLADGFRLVLTEEHLDEFARSGTLDAALSLTRQAVQRKPLWLRSFADLKTEEVCRFAAGLQDRASALRPVNPFVENFVAVSQIGEKHRLDPEGYVRFAAHPTARQGIGALLQDHAAALNALTAAEATGQLTRDARDRAMRASLRSLLTRGISSTTPAYEAQASVDLAVKHCSKHLRHLMRECPAFATEVHLSDYRCANPKRKARESDSRDLMMSVAAYPYVSTFVTNDGFLHGGLQYVRTRLPGVRTELLQRPPTGPANEQLVER